MVRRVALYLEPLRGTEMWGRPCTPQRHCAPAASFSLRSMPLWDWGYSQPLRGCTSSEPFLAEACALEPLRGTGVWGRPRTPQRHCAPVASLSLRSMPLWGWGYAQPLRGCERPSKTSCHYSVPQSVDLITNCSQSDLAATHQPRSGCAYPSTPHWRSLCGGKRHLLLPRTAARFQLPFDSLRLLGINIISFN